MRRPRRSESRSRALRAAAERISRTLDTPLKPLRALAAEVASAADTATSQGRLLTEAALLPILPRIQKVVLRGGPIVGHGFIAAPGAVEGRQRYLLWLQRREGGARRLELNFDPDDVDVYDYLKMEWFTAARDRHVPVLFGPYLDYSGADLLVLTATVPVLASGVFLGVAGADLLMSDVETALVHELKHVEGDSVIVNADRTVVAASSPRWLPGERMKRHPTTERSAWAEIVPLAAWTGWLLALAAGSASDRSD